MSLDLSAQAIPPFKHPQTTAELTPPIAHRWSPRAFLDKPVTQKTLHTILEAARWAASCNNEQPWRYIVARRENPGQFKQLLSVLVEKNQRWARGAPVLMLSAAKRTFAHSGKPNRFFLHDLGAASATLAIQAASMGVQVHQMAGLEIEKAREVFKIPEDFEPGAALALGYPAPAGDAPEEFRAGESSPRTRKALAELVFSSTWGESITW